MIKEEQVGPCSSHISFKKSEQGSLKGFLDFSASDATGADL